MNKQLIPSIELDLNNHILIVNKCFNSLHNSPIRHTITIFSSFCNTDKNFIFNPQKQYIMTIRTHNNCI